MKPEQQRAFDRYIPYIVYAVTGLTFLPVINWILAQTIAHEQLLHAFLVFLLTGGLLIFERRIGLKPVCRFSDTALNLLVASYVILGLAIVTRQNLAVLAALSLSLASFMVFFLGDGRKRLVFSSVAAFAVFTGFAVMLPVMDWPLRSIAGQAAAHGLGLFGHEVQLGLVKASEAPMLLLVHRGKPFDVAAECNGFGMLTSSLLMATIIVLYRRLTLARRLGLFAAAVILGVAFNAIRIIIIVLLAPYVAEDRYMLMHEIVGITVTYGGLALIYFLLMPRRESGA